MFLQKRNTICERWRASIVAVRDIEAGQLLSEQNIAARRPGNGMPAAYIAEIIGLKAVRKYRKESWLSLEILQVDNPDIEKLQQWFTQQRFSPFSLDCGQPVIGEGTTSAGFPR